MRFALSLLLLIFIATGCSDFSQHRFGGVRQLSDVADSRPTPGPALAIPDPPKVAQQKPDENVRPATFTPDHPMRVLYERAAKQHSLMDSYIFRMKRREVVSGAKQPEEIMLVKIRREPYSVYLKWLGPNSKGREVVYVKGKYENKMQVLTADGDLPFIPGGSKWSFALDSALVQGKSRYPITGTGFGSLIERYGNMVKGIENGVAREGTAKYLGKVKRPEFDAPVETVQQSLPPNADTGLPKGGQRTWHFDAVSGLPVLIIATDPSGEVEYYCHDLIQWPVKLDEDDFNPKRLWQK